MAQVAISGSGASFSVIQPTPPTGSVTKTVTFSIPSGTWTAGIWTLTGTDGNGGPVTHSITTLPSNASVSFPAHTRHGSGTPFTEVVAASGGQVTDIQAANGGSLSTTLAAAFGSDPPGTLMETITSLTLTITGTPGPDTSQGPGQPVCSQ